MEIRTIKPFLKYFDSVRERTMRVTRLIPLDKLDWTCAPGPLGLSAPLAVRRGCPTLRC